jgi:uncharacterized RDD family membrane protein YckC
MGPIWGVAVIAGTAPGDTGSLLLVFAGVVAPLVYGFLLEGLCGYTPGTYLLRLVVVTSDGSTCTVGASVLRNLLWIVEALPTANPVAMALIPGTDDNRLVGDPVADTVVVRRQ